MHPGPLGHTNGLPARDRRWSVEGTLAVVEASAGWEADGGQSLYTGPARPGGPCCWVSHGEVVRSLTARQGSGVKRASPGLQARRKCSRTMTRRGQRGTRRGQKIGAQRADGHGPGRVQAILRARCLPALSRPPQLARCIPSCSPSWRQQR